MYLHAICLRKIAALLVLVCTAISVPLAAFASPEVYAIGIYEGNEVTGDQVHGPEAHVKVDRPGTNAALFLGSYSAVRWYVETTEGTTLASVALYGMNAEQSEVYVNGELFRDRQIADLPTAHNDGGRPFRQFVAAIHGPGGPDRLDLFLSSYTAPEAGFVIDRAEPDNPNYATDPQVRLTATPEVLNEALRSALAWQGPNRKPEVKFGNDGFYTLGENGDWTLHPVTLDVPEISWPVAGVRDNAGVLYGVSLGGDGLLYRYDPVKTQWTVLRSMDEVRCSRDDL